jgi:hypothetical protein
MCDLLARYHDPAKFEADPFIQFMLVGMIRKNCRPFLVPKWLAESELWQDYLKAERVNARINADPKARAGGAA